MVRVVLLAALLLPLPAARPADAQVTIEAGGYVGEACDISLEHQGCHETGALIGPYMGVWFRNRKEVRVRYVEFRRDDIFYPRAPYGSPRGIVVSERVSPRRTAFLLGEITYHFVPEHPVRPFLGVSAGLGRNRSTRRCEPVSCAEAGLPIYPDETMGLALGVVAGLSSAPIGRLRVQGVVGLLPGGGGPLVEAGVLVGVRLWRSR